MATQSQNGVAKKPAQKKVVAPKTESTVVAKADATLKKMVEFQQTVEKINELQRYVDDYNKVSETLKGLSQFKTDGSNESIRFVLDHMTQELNFTTFNSTLINMVIGGLIERLQAKRDELVEKILNFEF